MIDKGCLAAVLIGRFWHEAPLSNRAEQCPLCPDTSDFDLLSDGERIIDLDSEISDRTFHTSSTLIATTSQPRSLLSMVKLKIAN